MSIPNTEEAMSESDIPKFSMWEVIVTHTQVWSQHEYTMLQYFTSAKDSSETKIATFFLPTDQPSHPLQAAIENLSKWNPLQTTGQSYFLQALVEELTKGQSVEVQWWNPNIQLLIEEISKFQALEVGREDDLLQILVEKMAKFDIFQAVGEA